MHHSDGCLKRDAEFKIVSPPECENKFTFKTKIKFKVELSR